MSGASPEYELHNRLAHQHLNFPASGDGDVLPGTVVEGDATPDTAPAPAHSPAMRRHDLTEYYNSPTPSLRDERLPAYSARTDVPRKQQGSRLRRNWFAFLLAVMFSAAAVYIWVMLVLLVRRGISFPSTADNYDYTYGRRSPVDHVRWFRIIGTMNSVLAVAVLLVTSTVLSRFAIVLTQKNKISVGNGCSLSQTYALADRGWLSFSVLGQLFRPKTSTQVRSWFLIYSTSLCLIALLIYPLQHLFLRLDSIIVPSAGSYYDYDGSGVSKNVTYDPAVEELAKPSYYARAVQVASIFIDLDAAPLDLWGDTQATYKPSYLDSLTKHPDPLKTWISAQPKTINLGVFNGSALRFNTSIACEVIPRTKYPASCPGANSYNTTLTWRSSVVEGDPLWYMKDPISSTYLGMDIRICVPGDYTVFPWKNTTSPQEDLIEELYFDMLTYERRSSQSGEGNYTKKCTARTTRGYFDLPNYASKGHPGELHQSSTPPLHRPHSSWNSDYIQAAEAAKSGSLEAVQRFQQNFYHGPLLTTAMVYFADYSNSTDKYGLVDKNLAIGFPLAELTRLYESDLSWWTYLLRFVNTRDYLETSLKIGTYLSTSTALTTRTKDSSMLEEFIEIPLDMGVTSGQLYLPLPVIIVISILLGWLCLNLLVLGFIASATSTWTTKLDAWAILVLGQELSRRLDEGGPVGVLHSAETLHGHDRGKAQPGLRQQLQSAGNQHSGVVGDLLENETIGMLAVGAEGRLRTKHMMRQRRYNFVQLQDRDAAGNAVLGVPPMEPPPEQPVTRAAA